MLRSSTGKEELYVDIGTYGVPKVGNFHPVETTRRVEEFVRSVDGYVSFYYFWFPVEPEPNSFYFSFQMLYADSYMTESEFHSMFNHSLYDQMRKKYGCDEAFPRVYSKVCRSARD